MNINTFYSTVQKICIYKEGFKIVENYYGQSDQDKIEKHFESSSIEEFFKIVEPILRKITVLDCKIIRRLFIDKTLEKSLQSNNKDFAIYCDHNYIFNRDYEEEIITEEKLQDENRFKKCLVNSDHLTTTYLINRRNPFKVKNNLLNLTNLDNNVDLINVIEIVGLRLKQEGSIYYIKYVSVYINVKFPENTSKIFFDNIKLLYLKKLNLKNEAILNKTAVENVISFLEETFQFSTMDKERINLNIFIRTNYENWLNQAKKFVNSRNEDLIDYIKNDI
jgi:hypothetical protein